MHCERWRSIVIGSTILLSIGFCPATARGQQLPAIEIAFPDQLVRGHTTMVHVAIPSHDTFSGAEVSPAAGVTVTRVANRKPAELSQNVAWWDVTIDVARDAAPGTRSLVLVTATGASTPVAVFVPGHVPAISNITVSSPASSRMPAIDVDFSAADEMGDLGDKPYVWFTVTCGGEPSVGVVRGTREGALIRASIPRPAANPCDLELRASDAQKNDSNSLTARVP
jgi:hypothetical protein